MNKRKAERRKRAVRQHRLSMLGICGVLFLLTLVLSIESVSLRAKNKEYQAMEIQLQTKLQEAQEKKEELDELEAYIGTDEYVAEVAKDKLGLVNKNEILFEPEP